MEFEGLLLKNENLYQLHIEKHISIYWVKENILKFSPVFILCKVPNRKFILTHVVHIIFPLDSARPSNTSQQNRYRSKEPVPLPLPHREEPPGTWMSQNSFSITAELVPEVEVMARP